MDAKQNDYVYSRRVLEKYNGSFLEIESNLVRDLFDTVDECVSNGNIDFKQLKTNIRAQIDTFILFPPCMDHRNIQNFLNESSVLDDLCKDAVNAWKNDSYSKQANIRHKMDTDVPKSSIESKAHTNFVGK